MAHFFKILKSPSPHWNGPIVQWVRKKSLLFANVFGHESQDICLRIFNYQLSLYLAISFDCKICQFPFLHKSLIFLRAVTIPYSKEIPSYPNFIYHTYYSSNTTITILQQLLNQNRGEQNLLKAMRLFYQEKTFPIRYSRGFLMARYRSVVMLIIKKVSKVIKMFLKGFHK